MRIKSFGDRKPPKGYLTNSEDPDEMPYDSIIIERNTFLEIISCDPSIYTMDHPNFNGKLHLSGNVFTSR